jgi:outer membrane receptor protein involved in Fe transport
VWSEPLRPAPDRRIISAFNIIGEIHLNSNDTIRRAVLAALGSAGAATAFGPQAMAADESATASTGGLEEIVVTAQRRTENIQDVPITIQAMTGEQLSQLNVTSFNELMKYTPNVTFSGNGPGAGNMFVRGLSSGGAPNQSQAAIAPFPNVALYLDDESMQFPGRNMDVYLADIERVEVLEGPQGTLFGGGAQAGAVRYITNKPKLNATEGYVNAGYGVTAGGDPNNNLNATFNLPLIDGKLAVRATIFSDHRGGYIDNVLGTIAVPAVTTPGGPPLRPGSPAGVNGKLVGDNLNTVQYNGGRLSVLYKFNDNWDLLVQQNYQQFSADGYFNTEPTSPVSNDYPNGKPLGPFQIMAFSPNFDKDKYQSTAWTVDGKVADWLNVVYTGSYMVRNTDQQQDYSNYMTSRHGSYYACSGQGAGYYYFRSAKATTCYPPVGSWRDVVENTHLSHELRLSTPAENRLRGTFGFFSENFVIKDDMNFNYMGIPSCDPTNLAISQAGGPDCVQAVGTIPGYYAWHPGLRLDTGTAFGEDVRRGYKQTAYFGSVDFDIIPKVLTVTAGIRHYKYDEFEQGSEYYSATSSILNHANGTPYDPNFVYDGVASSYGFGINLKKSESGNKNRVNVTWHITPDTMVYATYSQGFRPGGFNRTHTSIDGSQIFLKAIAPYTAGVGASKQFNKPAGFESDNLVNKEIGAKTEWLDHRLQVNASIYRMDWSNVQLPLFDPVHLGNTTFVINGPTYQVTGYEVQFVARVTDGLTVQGSLSHNSSKQTNAPCLASNIVSAGNPTPVGQCITQINGQPYTNPYGVLGTTPPFSPKLQYNARARYDWTNGDLKPFVSLGANYTDSMRNQPESFPDGNDPTYNPPTTTLLKYTMPSYTTVDAAIGATKGNWSAQLSVINLTNNDASTLTSSGQFIKSIVPLRPRVITFEFGLKF